MVFAIYTICFSNLKTFNKIYGAPWVFHEQAFPECRFPAAFFLPWAFPDWQCPKCIFPELGQAQMITRAYFKTTLLLTYWTQPGGACHPGFTLSGIIIQVSKKTWIFMQAQKSRPHFNLGKNAFQKKAIGKNAAGKLHSLKACSEKTRSARFYTLEIYIW